KTWSLRNQTSRWLRTSKSVGPTLHLSKIGTTANIPSATRLPRLVTVEALGFASQPFDWFAFSRMMTLQARLTRNTLRIGAGRAFPLQMQCRVAPTDRSTAA